MPGRVATPIPHNINMSNLSLWMILGILSQVPWTHSTCLCLCQLCWDRSVTVKIVRARAVFLRLRWVLIPLPLDFLGGPKLLCLRIVLAAGGQGLALAARAVAGTCSYRRTRWSWILWWITLGFVISWWIWKPPGAKDLGTPSGSGSSASGDALLFEGT